MSFHFVDNSNINSKARKTIRSHVMKGKNCGKTRSKKEKQFNATTERSIVTYRTGSALSSNKVPITTLECSRGRVSMLAVTREVANDPSLVSSTTRITPQAMLNLQKRRVFDISV